MPEVRLPADAFSAVFEDGVLAPALSVTCASDRPRAVFLGGQPGCGKSTIARSSCAWFGTDNFVHVDVDRLRSLHPAFLPMVSNPATERDAPSAVQKDCSLWADMLRDRAIGGQRNVLLENTMRSPSQVRESATALRKAGYAIDARIMAVHAKSSEVSLLQRFEHEKQTLGYGREIPVEYHDLAAAGIVETVKALEAEKLVDHLVIFDRSGRKIYENELIGGEWRFAPDGSSTMERFRQASYDVVEKIKISTLWDDVVDMMERRGAKPEEIAPIQKCRGLANLAAVEATSRIEGPMASSPGVQHNFVTQGDFSGRIVEHRESGEVVVQKVGRDPDKIALHDGGKLSRKPDVGEVVDISYRTGLGEVSRRAIGRVRSR